MTGSSDKASHYISLLDTARVNGSWSEFPELIRKVNKHAPQQKTLLSTATAEYEVATGLSLDTRRPATSSGAQSTPLAVLSNILQSGNEADTETTFQGKTCLLWSRWIKPEGSTATVGFDTTAEVKSLGNKNLTTWTKICIIKSAYIEGARYVQNGRVSEAQKVFNAAVSVLQLNQELVLATPQFAYWSEQLLGQFATTYGTQSYGSSAGAAQLEIFRNWAAISSKVREVPASTYKNSSAHLARLPVWRKYYKFLSDNLAHTAQASSTANVTDRLQQSTEVRKVERAYENELLRGVKFPDATQTNEAVQEWVEQAIRTWQILCGPQWRDSELGEGGRNAIARNMLDILYRAATKTFHSTLILRRLFQVHLSLGEFELAYRAFDTYIELVDRGRERVAKSKTPEPGHETDNTILATISEAIVGLCKFGRQSESRKAYELSVKLEDWSTSTNFDSDEVENSENLQNGHGSEELLDQQLSPSLLQTVYRAIGMGKAHWARCTPASESRSRLQEEALISLRKASSQGEPEIETLYAISLLMAETRNISGAIGAAKQALATNSSSQSHSSTWATERKLVPLWHILALLLSSRQEFDSATKSCVAAFEQFASHELHHGPGRNSSISSDIEKQFNVAVSGFADEMEVDELQRVIEVRITELALTELMDGPEEAVNSCNELLSLFSRLFAHLKLQLESSTTGRAIVPPKTSASTIKSARNSMFGRKRHEGHGATLKPKGEDMASVTTEATRPSTRATQAPTIEVTNEDEKQTSKKHILRKSYDSSRSKLTAGGGSQRLSIRHSHHGQSGKPTATIDNAGPPSSQAGPLSSITDNAELSTQLLPLEHEKSTDNKQELPKIDHNLDSRNSLPPPVSHDEQPPQQDVRLPTVHSSTNATSPTPRSSKPVAQKQALAVLLKVWLVIATLYRRASMFEDSKEACEEAGKIAAKIEALTGAVDHSARTFAEAGWGVGSKSADEVWADVYCERAELQLAIYKHKIKHGNTINNEDLRTAVDHYEQCLMFEPNHPAGIIGLSNVLLDSYERKVDLGRRVNDGRLQLVERDQAPSITVTDESASQSRHVNGSLTTRRLDRTQSDANTTAGSKADDDLRKTPENLNRIAARDRAYGLLSTLTKLGSGWDNSEAWFALARAHELGGEVDKAKSILWWCIELEDTKPIRHWRNLGYCL